MKDLNGHNSFEIIQKLIDGEFSSTEAKKFSDIINSDAGLKSEFDKYHKIKKSINADKKSQMDNSVPTSQMKDNLFKELNFGTGSNVATNVNRFNLSSLSWMLDFKTSVPAAIAFVVVSSFLLFNNSKESNSNNKNKKENLAKIAITKSSDNNDEVVTKLSYKFNDDKFIDNDNLTETNNLNNQKNIVRSKDKTNKNKTISNRVLSESKIITKNDDKNLSNKRINDFDFSSNYNANINIDKSEAEAKTNTNTNINKEDSNNSLLITENKLNINYFDLNKEFDNISYSPNNKNINTIVLKSKYNKIDENSKLGISIISLTQNTNLGKDFVIAGYYKVNNGENYNLELGIEYNSVILQTLSNNILNTINGPGIGLRFQSNKVLQSLIGEEFSDILNAYSMASIGSTTPGQYYKLSAGMQIKLFEVSNINFELMSGYEYFSLIQSNSTFITNRSGLVSGFVIKF